MVTRRIRALTLLTVLAAAFTAACDTATVDRMLPSDDQAATPASPPANHRADAADITAGATITPADPPASRPITIAFAGDVHFEGALRSRLDDPATALGPIAEHLAGADIAILNLESAVGVGGDREPKRFTFQVPVTAFDALSAAGVDVVTMANNHAGDFGFHDVDGTLAAAGATDPPLAVVGIGSNAGEAFAPARIDVDGTTVAVIGASASDHDPTADPTGHWAATDSAPGIADAIDPARLLESVSAAAESSDVVVVYLHWGVQGQSCPSDDQAELAQQVNAAGADIIVGSHAHRLQGAGTQDDSYVAYGLGNFVWYTQSPATSATGVLTVTVEDGRVVADDWQPARIGASGIPEIVTGDEALAMTADFRSLRECTDLDPPP